MPQNGIWFTTNKLYELPLPQGPPGERKIIEDGQWKMDSCKIGHSRVGDRGHIPSEWNQMDTKCKKCLEVWCQGFFLYLKCSPVIEMKLH